MFIRTDVQLFSFGHRIVMSSTPHEDRFLAILQHAVEDADVLQELSIPRKARKLDAVVRLDDAPELFGALAPWLQHRAVVFEHESTPPTAEAIASAALGHAWLHWHRLRSHRRQTSSLRRTLQGTPRAPIAVLVADRVVQDPAGAVAGLRPAGWRGVWTTPNLDEGGLLLLDSSQLVGTPGLEFWAWLGGAPTAEAAAARFAALLDSLSLSTITRYRLTEAIMNHQIPATAAEQETTYQRVTRLAREEGRDAGRDEARASLLELIQRYAPERFEALRGVHDLDELKRELDEAIQRRLSQK